ncbi:MAG: hypothetical protein DCF15_10470 [Phormidesmis priestleyi]|uniref:Uncharacterized protein n=1 Tax=Phormidesmis priestleyi TaxID=268141 RepID=A0A2W4ZB08_9CYAN|nr:MAG: hypothetical protein DCF15_10470 [Phormidesmis priestleyi]
MNFSTQQLPSGKWGIYSDSRLLATVSCKETCLAILSNLSTGRRDAPINDIHALYKVPVLRHQSLKPSAVQNESRDIALPATGAELSANAKSKARSKSKSKSKSKAQSDARKRRVSPPLEQSQPSSKQRSSKVNNHASVGAAS